MTAIICFINEPTSFLKCLGIYLGVTILVNVVEFIIIAFSKYYIEKYDAIIIFCIGQGIALIVAIIMLLLYITPLWLAILEAFIFTLIMLLFEFSAFILGVLHSARRS